MTLSYIYEVFVCLGELLFLWRLVVFLNLKRLVSLSSGTCFLRIVWPFWNRVFFLVFPTALCTVYGSWFFVLDSAVEVLSLFIHFPSGLVGYFVLAQVSPVCQHSFMLYWPIKDFSILSLGVLSLSCCSAPSLSVARIYHRMGRCCIYWWVKLISSQRRSALQLDGWMLSKLTGNCRWLTDSYIFPYRPKVDPSDDCPGSWQRSCPFVARGLVWASLMK